MTCHGPVLSVVLPCHALCPVLSPVLSCPVPCPVMSSCPHVLCPVLCRFQETQVLFDASCKGCIWLPWGHPRPLKTKDFYDVLNLWGEGGSW